MILFSIYGIIHKIHPNQEMFFWQLFVFKHIIESNEKSMHVQIGSVLMTWFLCLGGFPLQETPPSGAVKDKTGSNVFFKIIFLW